VTRTKDASNWSDSELDKLRHLWAEGWAAADIAWELGRVSRSAVLGKVRRLGLPYRRTPGVTSKGKVRRVKAAAPFRFLNLPRLPNPKPGDKRSLNGGAWEAIAGTTPVPLVDLEPGMCRWPIGKDSPYLFCGCGAIGTYCEYHAAVAQRRVPVAQLAEVA